MHMHAPCNLHGCWHTDDRFHVGSQAAQTLNIDVSMLTLRQIGNALFGRPAVQNGGPTHFDVLPVLPKTDTKSYEDWHRTCGHLNAHCESSVKVKLVHTDGQGSITGKNKKKKFTDQYADYVLCVTGFHEHAHSAFAYNEAFFEKYLAWCYNKIG